MGPPDVGRGRRTGATYAATEEGPISDAHRSRWLLAVAAVVLVGAAIAVVGALRAGLDPGASTEGRSSPAADPGPDLPAAEDARGWRVVNVVDGDTLDVRSPGGAEERVRVIGIDAPERGECGYGEASVAVADLVFGRDVDLVPGARGDRDRYGRLLRYVDVDGVDAGLELLHQGLAIARYDSRDGYGAHPREAAYVAADAAMQVLAC